MFDFKSCLIPVIICFTLQNTFIPPAASHHVVFEEVGQIATSLAYVHVAIPLNVSGLGLLLREYSSVLLTLMQNGVRFTHHYTDGSTTSGYWKQVYFDETFVSKVIGPAMADFKTTTELLFNQSVVYHVQLEQLRQIMPRPPPSASTYDDDNIVHQHRR